MIDHASLPATTKFTVPGNNDRSDGSHPLDYDGTSSRGISNPHPTKISRPRMKIAYMMSRFPKITETFVLYEMIEVEKQGVEIEIYPLQRERTSVMHPEAVALVERANFQPLFSWAILCAHLYFLFKKPFKYLGALKDLLRGTWGSRRYFFGALVFFPKIVLFARQMEASGITHIHAHFASHPTAAAFVIHRLTGIPYSFTAHGSDIHRDKRMLREKVAEAAFAVPISDMNRRVILDACDGQYSEKLMIIHCGVDTAVFQANPEPEEVQGLKLLCIGTLHEVKGQTYLIDACHRLQKEGIDFTCHLIADGPDMEKLQEQVKRLELESRVVFHGRLPQKEVARHLQEAHIVVAPSVPSSDGRREGIPVALMEAMASGVPVVASKLSGIPELVGDQTSGLLAPPRDVEALSVALQRLCTDRELRQRLGQAGREKIEQEFNLTKNAACLIENFTKEA